MSRTKFRKVVGAKLLDKNGSLVFCENCEKIVGSINRIGYRYMKIVFSCTCGTYGNIEIVKVNSRLGDAKQINKMPGISKGVCRCTKCDTPLLSMIDSRVLNYSFFAECVCGEAFDTKPNFNKRLGETLDLFEKWKNK